MRLYVMTCMLLLACPTMAEDHWRGDLQIYGWVPTIDNTLNNGLEYEITSEDLLKDIDLFLMTAGRIRKNRCSFALDLVYADVSDKKFGEELLLEGLVTLDKGGLETWIVTPNIGYMIVDNEQQRFEVYAGARYFWLEVDVKLEIEPILPGKPSTSERVSDSMEHWDAIAGVRGLYYLSDKWYIPYSVNVGTGDSDFTWSAWGGAGYRFTGMDAMFGWRYMTYEVGSDTTFDELTLSGPFVGAVFRW
jgi:hypothetical protein